VAPEELAQLALTGMARKALAVAWGIEVGPQTE
jgi:hypothetical protein